MGYEVLAFVSLEIAQGRLQDVCSHLREIPEVLEIHSVTGPGDLHCRVVARTNDHLQHVIGRVLEVAGINRTATQIALTEQLHHRVLPLVELAIDDAGTGDEAEAG
jgi:DNA-binding Lrp family transcriptional regulator